MRVTVVAHMNGIWTDGATFQADVELTSGQGWTTVEIPAQSFKHKDPATKQEETMPSFAGVRQFHFTIESADKTRHLPALGLIKWLP